MDKRCLQAQLAQTEALANDLREKLKLVEEREAAAAAQPAPAVQEVEAKQKVEAKQVAGRPAALTAGRGRSG